ncbi:aspartate aminotransferase AspB [Methanocaldococcus villosus KIN24-T80]|uniref:Aminotransferase n=1 Tax=Methanocaldococcus villosus KIN24-T80 TaxID=1069083 RepID=N6V326_9EURY|nr:pyridoxal phosphate-dependent aminotransferase [Methanocaldococcus villosus]ENN96648.1 aspartate aminotransferase AspB [Methanocaldococcus villosus KIN24-T80]
MIAKRCLNIKPSPIREVFNLANSNSINLGIGEPDFKTPEYIIEAAKRALDEGKTHYSPNNGIPELREAISEKLKKDYNIEVSCDNIMITCGASEGLMLAILSLVDRGDVAIVKEHTFVSYNSLINLAEGQVKAISLNEEFEFDVEELKEMIDKRTKLIIYNSPSNPTGKVYDKETVKAISEIAEDYNLIIISDEVYDKIVYEKKHYSPLQFTDRAILVNSFSKTYAMTGWRVGYLAVPEELNNELNLIDNFIKIHQYSFACATTFAQYGALEALKRDDFVNKMVKEFKRRRNLIYKGLKDIFNVYKPDGTFYIYPDVSEYGDSLEVAKKLIENNILCVPSIAFGNSNKYIRFSFATKYEDIEKAIEIIKELF